jgi:hypothetical protein
MQDDAAAHPDQMDPLLAVFRGLVDPLDRERVVPADPISWRGRHPGQSGERQTRHL